MENLIELYDDLIRAISNAKITKNGAFLETSDWEEHPLKEKIYKGFELTKFYIRNGSPTNIGVRIYGKIPSMYNPERIEDLQMLEFYLREMPGCCGLGILYHSNISPAVRGNGIAQDLMPLKLKMARDYRYRTVICTTKMFQEDEVHILEKFGWKKVHEYKSIKTMNKLGIYLKVLD